MWNNFLEAIVYFKKNVVQNNQIFIDSIQKIKENKEKRQYEFSKSYFLFGNDKTKVLYSPLGNFYNDIVLYNERNGYYNTKSEFSFKEFSDKFSYYLLNGGWNKTWLEFIVYWKNLYSIKTESDFSNILTFANTKLRGRGIARYVIKCEDSEGRIATLKNNANTNNWNQPAVDRLPIL